MPIFYRYLIRETLALFLATNFILMSILLSFRLASLLSAAAAGKLALSAVWELIALQSVRFLLVLMPLAFVLAAVMSLGRLYKDSEITAALACGISPKSQRRALLCCAVPIALLIMGLNLFVMPTVYQKQETLRQKAQQEAGLVLFTPNTFRRLDDGTVVHTGAMRAERLENFFIARQEENGNSVITATAGILQTDDYGKHLILENGQHLAWEKDFSPQKTTLTRFKKADLRLPGEDIALNTDRLRNIPTANLGNSPAHLSEWQARLNPAFALILFTFFLPWLAKTKPRTGRYQKILPTFLLFALYINGLDLLVSAVKKEKISPFLGSFYLHLAVFGLLIIFLFCQRERRSC